MVLPGALRGQRTPYPVGFQVSEANRVRGALPARALRRLLPSTVGRLGILRLAAAVCTLLAAVLSLAYTVRAVKQLSAKAVDNAALNNDDREFGGGNTLGVDKAALYEARALIPEDARYRVVTGPRTPESLAPHIAGYTRFFLMPRRLDDGASWVLCYGCDPASLEGRLRVLWRNKAGILIGRLPP